MDEIRNTLQLILNTVLTIRVDGQDGNWNKLLGVVNTLQKLIDITAREEVTADGERDPT